MANPRPTCQERHEKRELVATFLVTVVKNFFTAFPSRFTTTPIDARHRRAQNLFTRATTGPGSTKEDDRTCQRTEKVLLLRKGRRIKSEYRQSRFRATCRSILNSNAPSPATSTLSAPSSEPFCSTTTH